MLSYFFYRIGEILALRVPLKTAYSIAIFLSDLRYLFAFGDRKVITENLRIIFPEKNEKEISFIRIQVFRNFAKYLVDFLRFKKVDMNYIKRNVKLINEEYIKEGLDRGKGVILLTAHLGNWELGGVVISMSGYHLLTVALPHKSVEVTKFFDEHRESKGIRVLSLGRAAKGCLKALRQNQIIALVGDRDFTEKGKIIDFFGKPAVFPEGPAVFSLQTGAVIIPGFMLRNKDDSFSLVLEKPLQYSVSGERDNDLGNIISQYRVIFEEYIRTYPDQWYMFRRFWKA